MEMGKGLHDGNDSYETRILQSIRRIIRAVDKHSMSLKSRYNITVPQLVCLSAIAEKGPMTATTLSHAIHLSTSTLVGIIDRLENKGYVHRHRDKKDRRAVFIEATTRGTALVKNSPSPLQDGLANALNELPEKELATILASLMKVVGLMEVEHLDASPILVMGSIESSPHQA